MEIFNSIDYRRNPELSQVLGTNTYHKVIATATIGNCAAPSINNKKIQTSKTGILTKKDLKKYIKEETIDLIKRYGEIYDLRFEVLEYTEVVII